MKKHPIVAFPVAVFALVAAASAQGFVIVVDDDGGPGVDSTTIAGGVGLAGPGDVVLVKSGEYGFYTTQHVIDGKAIVLTADVGSDVVLHGGLEIRNLASEQSVTVSGIRTGAVLGGPGLLVDNCQGPVLIERCEISGGAPFAPHGTDVRYSSTVTVVDSILSGQTSALRVLQATAHVYGCTLSGGDGVDSIFPSPGAPAASVEGGFLFASGSTFLGGDGVAPSAVCWSADGGAGLEVESGSVELFDNALVGGAGSTVPGCSPGAEGPGIDAPPGAVHMLPGSAHGFHALSPVRADELGALTFEGAAGDLAWLLVSVGQAPAFVPAWSGTLLPAAPTVAFVGALPPGGVLTLPVSVGPPSGSGGLSVVLQAAYLTPSQVVLGEPRPAVLLSSAY